MAAIFSNSKFTIDNNTFFRAIGRAFNGAYVGAFQLFAQCQPHQIPAPLTGTTVQVNDQTVALILNPAGTISTLTVNFPLLPYDGQNVQFTSTQTVTTLTLTATGTGQLIAATPTAPATITSAISTHFGYIYDLASLTWYAL